MHPMRQALFVAVARPVPRSVFSASNSAPVLAQGFVRFCSTAAAAAPADGAAAASTPPAPELSKEEQDAIQNQEKAARRRELILKHARERSNSSVGTGFEDITEFFDRNAKLMEEVKKAIEAGKEPTTTILQYFVMFGGWLGKKAVNTKEWWTLSAEERQQKRTEVKTKRQVNRATADMQMAAFYQSQELINLMKFKGVTFDNGKATGVPAADFEGFSRRVCDNYDLFKKTEAYSNLEFHVVCDPSKTESRFEQDRRTNYRDIEEGSLTNWLTEEQPAHEPEESSQQKSKESKPAQSVRPSPYSVDYETGEVTVLDTCSPDEFLDFLEREAPRAELRQQALANEQTKLYEEMAAVQEKLAVESIAFNSGTAALYDKDFKKLRADGREKEYVLPAEVAKALSEFNAEPRLYRKYLKGHHVRFLPVAPARAYYIDLEEKEVCIPVDFYKDTFLPIHKKYRRYETVERNVKKLKYVGWVILITLLGDVEWPAFWPIV
ncbi:hypothetical protein DIPPA_20030 [Diplonema papillatum]|nr:hypothetical protein DIPPA_20030 [Diplonema papillatum]